MEITDVSPQKKRGRYNIFIDDVFWGGVSERVVAKYNLYSGKDTEDLDLDELFAEEIEGRLYDRCIGKLANRPQSEFEIRRYIQNVLWKKKRSWFGKTEYEKSYDRLSNEFGESVVRRLQRNKLLSDEAFAKWWVEQRVRHGLRGWGMIRAELGAKGISNEIIESVKIGDSVERNIAREAYQKYCKRKGLDKDSCVRRLQARGFSWSVLEKLISDEYSSK